MAAPDGLDRGDKLFATTPVEERPSPRNSGEQLREERQSHQHWLVTSQESTS